ncbi:MAG: methyltransferase [Desulfobacteraceae bacterium]|nr:MAG: methyltransferase [Desulfobacteraceae bacterium]
MNEQPWHPGTLLQLAGSYWQTFALHAGVKLKVFTHLAGKALTAEEAAGRMGAAARGLTRLLNALSAMRLLEKEGDRYALSDAARRYLVEGAPEYVGFIILHHHHLSGSWARLDEAVHSGRPLRARAAFNEEGQREAFLMGMFNSAMLQAPAVVNQVDLGQHRTLLDLGGGPGTYAIHFCQKNPQLQAVVFDLPTTRPFAEKTIERFGLSERIRFDSGDYLADEIDSTYDVVWMSHILHAEGPEDCRQIISKAVRTLSPGGMILIHEFILDDSMDGPLFAALFSLNMLLGTPTGRSYSEAQLKEMLADAGIAQIRREAYRGPNDSGIISGVRDNSR